MGKSEITGKMETGQVVKVVQNVFAPPERVRNPGVIHPMFGRLGQFLDFAENNFVHWACLIRLTRYNAWTKPI